MADTPPKEKTEVTATDAQGNQTTAKTTKVDSAFSAPIQTAPPQIADHQLLRCIGRGSYGEVWLARNVMGTYRAVKIVYRKDFQSDRPYEREFEGIQKCEPISRSHEGLVDILHVGRNDQAGYFYYVMELADDAHGVPASAGRAPESPNAAASPEVPPAEAGTPYTPRTLRSEIQRRSRLPFDDCVAVGLSLARALAYLHEQGLVHRDIKPANIIFVKGVPKLADIGLVCGTEGTISYVGTEGFIPPEGPGTAQADLYSLGKVFYEMSTGKDRQDFPNLPTDLGGPGAEQAALLEFNEVVLKACASQMSKRYQTARHMETELCLLQAGKSIKRERTVQRRWTAARTIGAAALIAALVLALWPMLKRGLARHPVATVEKSIAVLPFRNESPNPEDELNLSEAIPDEVISALTKIGELKVAPPTLSFAFKGGSHDWSSIGQKLKVGAVLGGKFKKSGSRLQLNIELISTADGYLLMSKPYRIEFKDLTALHNDIARQVAAALKVSLATEEAGHLARKPTENPEAWRAYLLGRQHWNQRMKPGQIQMANNYFAQAIALDTNFAQAYAGLAEMYAERGYLAPGDLPPHQAFPKTREYASKALAIDDRLPDAHDALGYGSTHYDWDWIAAEREFRQAIEINPNYAEAHHGYSHLLMVLGRSSESLRESKLALELAPIDAVINTHLGWHYFYNGQYDNAMAQWQKSILMDPDFPMFHYFVGCAYEQKRESEKAITAFTKAVELSKRRPLMLAALGHAYAAKGERGRALDLLGELNERAKTQYVDQAEVAIIHIGLGDKVQAFACLNKAVLDRSGWLVYLNVEPWFDSLREDPRFNVLLKRVGLPLPAATNSVAVLPFEDLSGERAQDRYGAGLTDTLINKLAGFQVFDVRSRERVLPYYGITNASLLEISRALTVRFLVKGTVQRFGPQLTINVQLLRNPSEAPLWTDSFNDQENKALTLQGRVAKALANELARAIPVPLSGPALSRVEKASVVRPEALALYFNGRAIVRRENRKDIDTAIGLLERAVNADSSFAEAYAELANAYYVKDFFFEPNRWKWKAQAALDTAVALNPDLPEAHLARGRLLWTPSLALDGDFPHEKAIQELRLAAALNPNLDEAHQTLAMIYLHIGLFDQALAEARKAIEIDPANLLAHYRIGVILHLQGKYEEALATLRPIPDQATEVLGRQIPWTLFQLGRYEEARSRLKQFREMYKDDPGGQFVSLEAMLDAVQGRAREAEEKIQSALRKRGPAHFHHTAYQVACAFALLNKPDEAVEWLREAANTGFPCYPLFVSDPSLSNIRAHAAFRAFEAELKKRWEGYKAAFAN